MGGFGRAGEQAKLVSGQLRPRGYLNIHSGGAIKNMCVPISTYLQSQTEPHVAAESIGLSQKSISIQRS